MGLATVATYVSHSCHCLIVFLLFGAVCGLLLWQLMLAMFALACCCSTLFVIIIDYLGQFGLHVNCFTVNEIGFSRLTAGVTICSTAIFFWLFKIEAASFFASWVLPFCHFFCFCFSDASPTILWLHLLGEGVQPFIVGTPGVITVTQPLRHQFFFLGHLHLPLSLLFLQLDPPFLLFDQLVQRVAAEVTRQLQPAQDPHLLPPLLFLVWPGRQQFNR